MPAKPTARKIRAAASLTGNLMLAPAVIAMRMPMLAAEAQSSNPYRVETTRAVTEKMSAMVEGALAAQLAFTQAAIQFWPEVWSGRTPSLINGVAADRALRAALKPSGTAVRSNHRRLSRSI
ncbi:hypothetical protein [Aliihoeflea sp. 40Bstr573]|uniref:hypothetical protein n=1 Tax=Aliihoeflea sp. 40Bstr573 TaxID=2696467 RepID=UPI0020956EB9|nr:hypothetical protein [Aliihoeflea sp. 40Bstr573]MCO6385400.1 hypothetical protein [Aliihoeflea sp. 40Bstr573]